MFNHRIAVAFIATLALSHPIGADEPAKNLGFEVPDGFEVTLYADDSLATDIHSLTIDSHGRVVVAGKGYIKILHDTKGVGKADKATLFADFPKSGAHGMYFDGDDLICNGDKGVRRLYDTQKVGRCDKVSDIWFPTKNDGEHAANGIVKGPDGWYYMITGNDAGITRDLVNSPRSPIKEPNSGTVIRFSPDGKTREIIAHGFRNPYDLAFNQFGQLFTVDSDGERVYHMPYYAPTRLFDIAQGMHHGWVTSGWIRSWSRPACWPDNVERMVELGRGSPTGLIVYRHRAFPAKYRNGVFSLCWTFGRLYYLPLRRHHSSYRSEMEVFMRTSGDVGFAPTDMAVGPDGDLFIAIGGRGTRGSVFRVHYRGKPPSPLGDDLYGVLSADEPLSSWSRARWVPVAKKLGKDAFVQALFDAKLPVVARIRAVEILTELFDGVPLEAAAKLCGNKTDPELAARVVWSVARMPDAAAVRKILVVATSSEHHAVARAAWEGLQTLPSPLDPATQKPDWNGTGNGFFDHDRRVRAAATLVAKDKGRAYFLKSHPDSASELMPQKMRVLWVKGTPEANDEGKRADYWKTCQESIAKIPVMWARLEAVRLMQAALDDVDTTDGLEKAFVGYVARAADKLDPTFRRRMAMELAGSFPAESRSDGLMRDLDLELARLLAMLEPDVPGLPQRIAEKWTKNSIVEDDIHYLLVMARLPGKRSAEVTKKTAAALNGVQIKLAQTGEVPSDFVPTILEAILERLMKFDPNLAAALVADPSFGVPGHAIYANKLPLPEKQAAARKLLAGIAKLDADQARAAWTPDMVHLAAALPDAEALPILRTQFTDPRLSDTVALVLAAKRQPQDRGRWLDALSSTQPTVVAAAAEALLSLPNAKEKAAPLEIGKVVRSLRRLENQKADVKLQKTLVNLLESWSGEHLTPKDKQSSAAIWVEWYTREHPQEAAKLPGLASADFATWKKRLDKIDWDKGDERRGETIFQRKNCYRCHGEARRLGPDLAGIAQRFSRDDLFTAIIDPSKDIAPAYKAISIVTKSGKAHNGMVIYESQQLYLLQTAPDTTVRIPGEEVEVVQPSAISFMPAGLLDDLSDGDLRDLYAFLKSLRKR